MGCFNLVGQTLSPPQKVRKNLILLWKEISLPDQGLTSHFSCNFHRNNRKLWILVTESSGEKSPMRSDCPDFQSTPGRKAAPTSRPRLEMHQPDGWARSMWNLTPFFKVATCNSWGFCLENIVKKVHKSMCIKYIISHHLRNKNHNSIMKTRMKWAPKRCKDLKPTHRISVSSPALFPGLPNATRVPTYPWRKGHRSSNENVSWRRFQGEKRVSSDIHMVFSDGILGDSW